MRILILLLGLVSIAYGIWEYSKSETRMIVGDVVAGVETAEKVVALTLDDGPSQKFTPEVLAILAEHGASATFFLNGEHIFRWTDTAKAIVDAGHEIGNHGWTHDRMVFRSRAWVRQQLEQTDAVIRALGYDRSIPFRPPYGAKLVNLPRVLVERGQPAILWSVAPQEQDRTPEQIAAQVLQRVEPGSIVLLHVMWNANAPSRGALPVILSGLKERGYRFVTVSELMAD